MVDHAVRCAIGADAGSGRPGSRAARRPARDGRPPGGGLMQKRYGLALFAGLAIILAACGGGGGSAAPSAGASGALTPIKVGVVTDVGQLEDKSFNQSSNEGAKAAATEAGGTHDVIVTQAISDYAANIQTLIDADFDVIVTVGFLHRDRHRQGGQGQPGHQVRRCRPGHLRRRRTAIPMRRSPARATPPRSCRTTRASSSPRPSPAISPASSPASLTKSGTIGAVGGTNVPAVVNYWRGYENGAKSVKADVEGPLPGDRPEPGDRLQRSGQGQDDRGPVHRTRALTSSSRSPA